MLRVTCSETPRATRWILCGRLAGVWVDELRSCWRAARSQAPHTPVFVDLNDVTYIDEPGEELLREMQSAGATFVVAGVENKHLVNTLDREHRRELKIFNGGRK
jgi:hypothetical protein